MITSFNLSEFIKNNLINGYKNGSFTLEQVNIFALNYLVKGQITQDEFDYIQFEINKEDDELITD